MPLLRNDEFTKMQTTEEKKQRRSHFSRRRFWWDISVVPDGGIELENHVNMHSKAFNDDRNCNSYASDCVLYFFTFV